MLGRCARLGASPTSPNLCQARIQSRAELFPRSRGSELCIYLAADPLEFTRRRLLKLGSHVIEDGLRHLFGSDVTRGFDPGRTELLLQLLADLAKDIG